MKASRTLHTLLTLALLALPPAWAQQPNLSRTAVLASSFDLDGEAADADQVVASVALTDAASFTIAANPDTCRLVDITVTDADSSISAGVLTVVGTDCWDYPMRASFTFAAGGTGVKTLTVSAFDSANPIRASGAYFKTVTAATTGTLTGEGGGDTVTIGYTANSANSFPMYGKYTSEPSGRRWVDVFGQYDVGCLVKNGAATTDVVGVSTSTTECFQNVSANDLIVLNIAGEQFVRKVVTRADADTITINSGVTIPTAGVNFSYKKLFFLADPIDGWIPVQGFASLYTVVDVDANANTGGVVSSIQCTADVVDKDATLEIDTDTVASGSTGSNATSIDLQLAGAYTHCRVGVKFGTGDDADTAAEDINLVIGVVKR